MREQDGAAGLEQDPERVRGEHRAEDDERRRGEHAVERVLQACGRSVPDERAHGRIIAAVRVAIVDPASATPPYDHSLASALARRGHSVDLLTSPFPFGAVPEPVGYRRDELFLPVSGRILARNPRSRARFALKGAEYLPSVRRLLRRLRELEPDVVHVQWLALPRLDVRWLRRVATGLPTVYTAHHALPRDAGARVDARRQVYDIVRRVVVHSRQRVDDLAAMGIARKRIAYIPHPVFELDTPAEPEPPVGSTLLFFGLIRAYKGLDVLVRALAELPGARLVVAGDPLDSVEPAKELARELGVDGRIDWRLGFLPEDEVARLMAAATLVVLPYLRTDASGVLATAIGHGRPVVVSDVGSLGETVREFGLGEVAPPGDAHALAEACRRLLSDPVALRAAFEGTQRRARSADVGRRRRRARARLRGRAVTVSAVEDRPVVVLGLLWAGLSFARSLGRAGVAVTGISMHPHEFGARSRYLRRVRHAYGDEAVLDELRASLDGTRPVLVPERDDHVELLLRHWDAVSELFELPLPPDPDVTQRLRSKARLPEEAVRAGVPVPPTVAADSEETLRSLELRPPYLLKPVEGQHFAGSFGQKVIVSHTRDDLVDAWREAKARGFDTVVQELVPNAHNRISSLFVYIGRSGKPLATVTGIKVRQGPIRFGTSAVFRTRPEPRVRELGLRLLETAGYRGFAQTEFAYDERDDEFKLLEVNTRPPVWAGIAMSRYFDIARIAYDDLRGCPEPERRDFEDDVSWSFLAKDVYVSLALARRRELSARAFVDPYLRRKKVRAVHGGRRSAARTRGARLPRLEALREVAGSRVGRHPRRARARRRVPASRVRRERVRARAGRPVLLEHDGAVFALIRRSDPRGRDHAVRLRRPGRARCPRVLGRVRRVVPRAAAS